MTLVQSFIVYISALFIFLVIDLAWLGLIARNFYRQQLSALMLDRIKWPPAIVFYLIYIIGVLVLAVIPAVNESSALQAASFGALLGFVSYSTYDLSNLATIKKWPIRVVVADICWGTVLTAVISLVAYLIAQAVI